MQKTEHAKFRLFPVAVGMSRTMAEFKVNRCSFWKPSCQAIQLSEHLDSWLSAFLQSWTQAPRVGGEPEGVQGGCPKLRLPAGACPCRDELRDE